MLAAFLALRKEETLARKPDDSGERPLIFHV